MILKIAQINPDITLGTEFEIKELGLNYPITLKANRKYVFVFDGEKMQLSIEPYWWFVFKNWFRKYFKSCK